MNNYLKSTMYLDFEDKKIQEFVSDLKNSKLTDREKAIECYLRVRDRWRYNAYKIYFTKEKWVASDIFSRKEAHCIDKSVLLIAFLRALEIPARIHLAKVKNHIAVEHLMEKLGTNELTPHGMVAIYLDGQWVKASPAFNASLCEKCNVEPLDFDGRNDSIFQEYNRDGQAFMEYLEDYGHFEDIPYKFIMNNFRANYPQFSKLLENADSWKLD